MLQVSYEISALESRVVDEFETLSAILFHQPNKSIENVSSRRVRHGSTAMAAFKYCAFLSYSHRDAAWAKWLHRALETYRIDKDLIGRETSLGPAPKTLRPIFRDREDFSAGHSLNEQTVAALEASQFLIVLCSPNAAGSPYVNEEIRHFKALGGAARVIPLIVDGAPGDPERECFPPAIRYRVGNDGNLTDEREEPIAADARSQGDGKEIAKQKVVAGLLGLPLDQMMRRAERARKRRNRLRGGAAAAAAIVLAAGYFGWYRAVGFASQLYSADTLSMETDAAEACAHASRQAVIDKVAEAQRIAFAVKCVRVLSADFDELAKDARVPQAFISAFEDDVAILQKFADAGKLTPDQLAVLAEGNGTVVQMKKLCDGSQSGGTGRNNLGFSC